MGRWLQVSLSEDEGGSAGIREAWADFDRSEAYRFSLGRLWDRSRPRLAFIMLNPSTADAHVLDPTVRRCMGFAKRDGYGSLEVGNLFALRATDPDVMKAHPSPIGQGNDEALLGIQSRASLVICAWGNLGSHLGRAEKVEALLSANGPLHALALTEQGEPRHPLYIRGEAKPFQLPPRPRVS